MKSSIKKGIAGIMALGSLGVGADAAKFERVPLPEQAHTIANERVSVKQTGNVVEAVMPWKGEKGLTIKHDLGAPKLSERVKDKEAKRVIAEPVDFGDGGFKIDILLTEKPDTNTFCYEIENADQYDFFLQPEITDEEAEAARLPDDTRSLLEIKRSMRPEEIVGSYAVYHKTLKNHKVGGQNYATGKVLHIPFPYIWEVEKEDQKVRAEDLTYENGRLCVVAPQAFLDTADYTNGVRVDPTFGYTSVGASNSFDVGGFADNVTHAAKHSAPENGTIDSIHAAIARWGAGACTYEGYGVIYENSDSSKVSGTQTSALTPTLTATLTFYTTTSGGGSVVGSTDYDVAFFMNATYGGGPSCGSGTAYDSGTTNQGAKQTTTATTPPDPATFTRNNNLYSIYATYTASGGGGSASVESDTVFFE
jgi:hypothetical protein